MRNQGNERSIRAERDLVARWLVRYAAHRAPEFLSSRLEEEWLADLECRNSVRARLGLALGCCWAAAVIAHEYSSIGAPAKRRPVPTSGHVILGDRSAGYLSLLPGTLLLILGLNAALFCGLITAL
jgi:hypothetical protein